MKKVILIGCLLLGATYVGNTTPAIVNAQSASNSQVEAKNDDGGVVMVVSQTQPLSFKISCYSSQDGDGQLGIICLDDNTVLVNEAINISGGQWNSPVMAAKKGHYMAHTHMNSGSVVQTIYFDVN